MILKLDGIFQSIQKDQILMKNSIHSFYFIIFNYKNRFIVD